MKSRIKSRITHGIPIELVENSREIEGRTAVRQALTPDSLDEDS